MANQALRNLFVACCALTAAGCTALKDCHDQYSQQIHTHLAWRDYDADGEFQLFSDYSSDYRRGWKSGYYRVLTTGDSRLPVLPPRRYWSPAFCLGSDGCGQQEWRNGYLAGARAAQCAGRRGFVRPFLPPPCDVCPTCGPGCSVANSGEPSVSIRLLGIVPIDSPPVDSNSIDSNSVEDLPGLIGPPQIDRTTETFPPPAAAPTELVPRQQ